MPDLTALADRYWEYRHSTDLLTALWKGDLAHLEAWEDLSVEGVEARRERLEGFAASGEAIDPAGLDRAARATRDTIVFTARSHAARLEWVYDLEPVNHEIGFLPILLTFLPRFPLITADHGERYLAKLAAFPATVDGLSDRLRRAAAAGRTPIRLAVAETVAGIDRYLAGGADPLARQAPPRELGPEAAARFTEAVRAALERHIRPALARFREVLETTVLPAARPDHLAGLCHLPGGRAGYERLVWANTSLDLSAEEVHRTGLAQVARLEEEYRSLAGPLLGSRELEVVYGRLRNDPALRYRDGSVLVADARAALAQAESAMAGWFGTLPRAACTAAETAHGALAFYSSPARDGSKPGTFFFNTSDPAAWGTFQLEAVTYHEGIPGHHLQIALAQELPGLHDVHRELYITAYSEGWGLYTERLADEMGLYTSALARVGMLAADSMRACRLVVDTGMHALGWSREQAIEYMLAHSPLSRRTVTGEIDRYIGDPGQALGYMIGRLEIDGIRRDAEERLGARFDIRGFHDAVLGSGSVPLPVLRSLVLDWVSATNG
jgi:uncharacterized protein (DUF885 family)